MFNSKLSKHLAGDKDNDNKLDWGEFLQIHTTELHDMTQPITISQIR